jgi:hypothetical protein
VIAHVASIVANGSPALVRITGSERERERESVIAAMSLRANADDKGDKGRSTRARWSRFQMTCSSLSLSLARLNATEGMRSN